MYVLVIDPRRTSVTATTIAYHLSQTGSTDTIVLHNEPYRYEVDDLARRVFESDLRDFEESLNEARRRRGLPSYTKKRFAPPPVRVPRSAVVPRRRPRSWVHARAPGMHRWVRKNVRNSWRKYAGSRRIKRRLYLRLRLNLLLERRSTAA